MHEAVGESSPQCEQWSQCALDTEMKSYYVVNVHSVSLIIYIFFFHPTCVTRCILSYSLWRSELSWIVLMLNTVIKVGMFSLGISAGNTEPKGKMYKHHYVLLQSCYQQMKDLMWALSALMIIMMGQDGLNMINPVHLFIQCTFTDKNMLVLSRKISESAYTIRGFPRLLEIMT